ncbi:hypothetical protein GCM10027291_46460 [Telluribacter humicola]
MALLTKQAEEVFSSRTKWMKEGGTANRFVATSTAVSPLRKEDPVRVESISLDGIYEDTEMNVTASNITNFIGVALFVIEFIGLFLCLFLAYLLH